MFRSNKIEAMLSMAKMLSLLSALMGTTKLVDVVWVEIISMEILHTGMLPFLAALYKFLCRNTPHSYEYDTMHPWSFQS